jgi:hypothetical protein
MRLLVAVALLDLVSARLGTADLAVEQVPSYFGEAAVVPVNAAPNIEAQEAPKLPILLTQSSLKLKESAPQQLKESAQPAPAQQHHGDLGKSANELEKFYRRRQIIQQCQRDLCTKSAWQVWRLCANTRKIVMQSIH